MFKAKSVILVSADGAECLFDAGSAGCHPLLQVLIGAEGLIFLGTQVVLEGVSNAGSSVELPLAICSHKFLHLVLDMALADTGVRSRGAGNNMTIAVGFGVSPSESVLGSNVSAEGIR